MRNGLNKKAQVVLFVTVLVGLLSLMKSDAVSADRAVPPSEKAMRDYIVSGKGYFLWSIGPDSKDNQGQVLYDTTNGTTSGGDLVLQADSEK